MQKNNFKKMIELATDIFDARNDPQQLDINENVIRQLLKIHPATVTEYADNDGPIVWVIVIPTTDEIMNKFLQDKITEGEILKLTAPGKKYNSIYLCSALVLPEFRRKGLAKKLTIESIEKIRKDHPVKSLFVWPFTREGENLAEEIAKTTKLPLFKKK